MFSLDVYYLYNFCSVFSPTIMRYKNLSLFCLKRPSKKFGQSDPQNLKNAKIFAKFNLNIVHCFFLCFDMIKVFLFIYFFNETNCVCGNIAALLAELAILALELADLLIFQWKSSNDFFNHWKTIK